MAEKYKPSKQLMMESIIQDMFDGCRSIEDLEARMKTIQGFVESVYWTKRNALTETED